MRWIDPADLPPLSQRPVICLVDTGLTVTPDAGATDPAGSVIARLAIDGGSGEPLAYTDDQMHGTYMAEYAIGAENTWGMTGIFPQGRIVSVRATTAAAPTSISYLPGMKACRTYALTNSIPVAVVNLSVAAGGSGSSATIGDDITKMHNQLGANVVAGAGNTPGPVQTPADAPGALAVAAGGPDGSFCSYASFGFGVDLVGPACGITDLDLFSGLTYTSDGGGSSMATAVTSATIAMLRTLRPDATWQQAEDWLTSTARDVGGYRVLNGEAAARAAGLGPVVDRAYARMSAGEPTKPDPDVPAIGKPRGTVTYRGKRLSVRIANRPRDAQLVVTAVFSRGELRERRIVRRRYSSKVTMNAKRRPVRVLVAFRVAGITGKATVFRPSGRKLRFK